MNRCAIILAAGRGSRMGDLTATQPKGLIGPEGHTTVESQLNNLSNLGLTEIRIVTGYLATHFEKLKVATIVNEEWQSSNMVYSLSKVYHWARNFDQILVSYADIFFPLKALESILAQSAHISMLYDVDWLNTWKARFEDPLIDAETFKLSQDGHLIEIGEKPEKIEAIQGQYMGLLCFSKIGWESYFKYIFSLSTLEKKRIDMTTSLNLFLKNSQTPIICVPFSGHWGEIDSKSDFELYFKAGSS